MKMPKSADEVEPSLELPEDQEDREEENTRREDARQERAIEKWEERRQGALSRRLDSN